MRVLLTRPEQDSLSTQAILEKFGITSTVEPLFTVQEIHPVVMPEGLVQGLIFTSRNSVRAFCKDNTERNYRVFCVGDKTARIASEFGFTDVFSADGNAHDLAELIISKCDPDKGALARFVVEMDHDRLVDELNVAGFTIVSRVAYRMIETPRLSGRTIEQLNQGALGGVCFFSPRAARHFYALLTRSGLTEACRSMTAWCISENTARVLTNLPFQAVRVADRPTHQKMIDLIKK